MTPSEQSGLSVEHGVFGEARRLHPATLVFAALTAAKRFIFPAFVGAFSASRQAPGDFIVWLGAILSVPAILFAVAKYVSFRYRLGADELVLTSGILRRRHRVIPFSRVQNIEMRQNLLQQFMNVAELRVETAGGAGDVEADLTVLARSDAEALRLEVMTRRQRGVAGAVMTPPAEQTSPVHTLARLGTVDLAIVGATANEAGLIAAALFGMLQFAEPFTGAFADRIENAQMPPLSAAVLLGAGLLLTLFLLGWVVSIVRSVVGFHDFTLERVNGELRKRYGLLSRREAVIPLERVQAIRIEESLLRRPLGLASLKVATAGGPVGERRGGAEAFLPLARQPELPALVAGVFPELDLQSLEFLPVHPRSRLRAFIRYSATLLLLTGALSATLGTKWALLLLLTPGLYGVAAWQYRHRGYALAPGFVAARNGVLTRITWIVPDHKLQVVLTRETPFQRRHGLASLVIDTAGGGRQATITDLARDDAYALREDLSARLLRALRRSGHRGRLSVTA